MIKKNFKKGKAIPENMLRTCDRIDIRNTCDNVDDSTNKSPRACFDSSNDVENGSQQH